MPARSNDEGRPTDHPALALVVAVSDNGVIGAAGGIPWRLPDDQRFFKRLTSDHSLIMGRATWDSIGRPLPRRTTVVLSRQPNLEIKGALVAASFDDAIQLAEEHAPERQTGQDESTIFVVGGAALYDLALPRATRAYVTRVHTQVDGDTFFSAFDGDGPPGWRRIASDPHGIDDDHAVAFTIETAGRRPLRAGRSRAIRRHCLRRDPTAVVVGRADQWVSRSSGP